tara:strand:+ start:1395 stop:1520 length:126 start_codon:yes stop_codon:yes gene_type:complete
MPIQKVGTKYRYGKKGKLYKTKKAALKQMRAMKKAGYKKKK